MLSSQVPDIRMPHDFPLQPYSDLYRAVVGQLVSNTEERRMFTWGFRGVARRFRSCCEADEEFRKAYYAWRNTKSAEDLYREDKALFHFFSDGLSAIETLFFALYIVGWVVKPEHFPTGSEKQIEPKFTSGKFTSHFPDEPLSLALKNAVSSSEYREWKNLRNPLAHRYAPGKSVTIDLGQGSAWHSFLGLELDEQFTSRRRKWLANNLCQILESANGFAKDHYNTN
jgi:hypothetical protein